MEETGENCKSIERETICPHIINSSGEEKRSSLSPLRLPSAIMEPPAHYYLLPTVAQNNK